MSFHIVGLSLRVFGSSLPSRVLSVAGHTEVGGEPHDPPESLLDGNFCVLWAAHGSREESL